MLYQFLLNKWYFDELYDLIFVRPALWLGRVFWKRGDGYVIDGFGPDGISARVLDVTRNVVRLQTGYLYHYAFAMLIGAAALITWFMFSGAERTDGDLADPLRHHVPAACRRAVHHGAAARRGRRRAMRAGSRYGPRSSCSRCRSSWCGASTPARPSSSSSRRRPWLGGFATYHMGVDGISLPFVILTTAIMPICISASWRAIKVRVKEYMIAFLVLETLMVGTFSALDLVLFYLFFEGGLIPMFLIIGVWGGPRRVYASFKFFLYTLLGSVLMLLAIMAMYWQSGTTDIAVLLHHSFPRDDADHGCGLPSSPRSP